MSFCCGAGMVGSIGTVRHYKTVVQNVPILFCPVCDRIEVHPAIEGEYEILVEYAQGDNAPEVDFADFVSVDNTSELFENCSMTDEAASFADVLKQQIDISLDLLGVAKELNDDDWRETLMLRLKRLSERLKQYNKRRESAACD
ncbi:hypothetical protein QO009_001683 [Brevibacillus aydinogluensis]|uniref:hypothetical protein n=1 Tax=Brevibacillus aydinogluensis TaxID=927786 RepID=UPI002893675D|nr:hypothetical protein [Brevibacillus aydinogluensis]MDT3415817.1 hypothetical protein [Brevibacillus aydinogluensis]